MDPQKSIGTTKINKILSFIHRYTRLNIERKLSFLTKLNKTHVNYISEICVNLLKFRLKPSKLELRLLNKIKTHIYDLSSKRVSLDRKRKILSSVPGLRILQIIFPLTVKTLSE